MEVSEVQYDLLMLKKYNDLIWLNISIYSMPVLGVLCLIKIFFPQDNSAIKKYSEMKRQWHDIVSALCIFYAPIYYAIDIVSLVLTGIAQQNQCKMDMVYHHIISAVFLPMVVLSRHIPSWQIAPAFMHALLLAYPEYKILNYPYLAVMVIFNVKLFSKPYTKFFHYKLLKIGVSILYACLILLWLHSCSNAYEDLPSKVTGVYPVPGYSSIFPFSLNSSQ